jgi:hypothetical protein
MVLFAVVLTIGIRIGVGQGYSDPIVRTELAANSAPQLRTLEVRLTNRTTGRSQYYEWSLPMPRGGSVEIECHEWRQVRWFGLPLFGAPQNSFRRVISLDAGEDGIAGPYHYAIRWRAENAEQGARAQLSAPNRGLGSSLSVGQK